MKGCSNCKWDAKTINCTQGHFRDWHHNIINPEGDRIPIFDCHAWKEEEKCECYRYRIGMPTILSIFFLTCKKCGRVIE